MVQPVRQYRRDSGLVWAANAAGVFIALGLTVADTLKLENGDPDNNKQGDEG